MASFSYYYFTGVLRVRWWLVVGTVAVALASAAFFTARQDPVYQAATTLTVVPAPHISQTPDILRALETLERRTIVATVARLADAGHARRAAGRAVGLAEGDLARYRVSTTVLPGTNILRITVSGPHGDRASALANALVRATAAEAHAMYRVFEVRPLETAVPATHPTLPRPTRNYAVAVVLGLLLGAAAALAVDRLMSARARRASPLVPYRD
jgi:capsular polysaccharide biosynthesis protein